MAVAVDTSASSSWATNATSKSVDITTAAIGSWVYVSVFLEQFQTSATADITFTGWTKVLENEIDSGTLLHYGIFKRQKISGDTTFTVSWTRTTTGTYTWGSYTGLDNTTPDEQATFRNATTTSIATSSLTPTISNCWAIMWAYANSSTNTARTFTADAALTERKDIGESGIGSSQELADSNGTVTVAAHSYTATASGSLLSSPDAGGAVLAFLRPSDDTPLGMLPVGF